MKGFNSEMDRMDRLAKGYSRYIDKNQDEIVKDFCKKIKQQKIGNLDLNTYSQFRYWKSEASDRLKSFHEEFKQETKDDKIHFDDFCEFVWLQMEDFMDEIPDDVSSLFKELNSNDFVAKA